MKVAIVDIETDNLLLDATTVHCIGVKVNDEATEVYTSRPISGSAGSLTSCMDRLKGCDTVVFHNGIKFDIPAIRNLLGVDLWENCVIEDTLIMSQLAYPNMLIIDSNNRKLPPKLKGSHSLKAWGYRLGNYKDQHEDWSKLSVEMVEYCRQDIEVTYSLFIRLSDKNIPREALDLEYKFARVIQRQEEYGVLFDIKKAEELHVSLLNDKQEAETELRKVFTPLLLPKGRSKTPAKPFTRLGITTNGEHQPVVLTEFNPSSRQHIAIWFKRWYGWESPVKTDKGNDKVDESVLKTLDFPEAKILSHYLNVNKLLGQLAEGDKAWLLQVRKDGRIHGSVNTLGAVSRRCTHSYPNMAQVPSVRAFRGKECRELFTVPEGRVIVGCDADALELRTLSHYMARYDGGKYGVAVDQGDKNSGTDIHSLNQKSAGLPTRDDAKTFILTQVIY